MKVDVIHSGSSGNMAVIDDTIIIDAGWSAPVTGEMVLLTHHHTDHTKHLDKVGGLPIYCTYEVGAKVCEKWPYIALHPVDKDKTFEYETTRAIYRITPISVNHDAPCVAFDIHKFPDNIPVVLGAYDSSPKRILFATDFSSFDSDERIVFMLQDKLYDAMYIECNNTLSVADLADIYVHEGDKPPKDEFHRRKSFRNHCSVDYLIQLFERAGYSEDNPCPIPTVLLHKSSYYYGAHPERLEALCRIANILNP